MLSLIFSIFLKFSTMSTDHFTNEKRIKVIQKVVQMVSWPLGSEISFIMEIREVS